MRRSHRNGIERFTIGKKRGLGPSDWCVVWRTLGSARTAWKRQYDKSMYTVRRHENRFGTDPRSSDHHSCSMWPQGPQCEVQRRTGLCAVHQSYRNLRRSTRYKKVYNQYRPKQSSKRKSTILSRERFASICTRRRRDDNGLTTSPSLLCRITMVGRCQRVIWARGWPPCASTCLVYTSSHSKCGAAIKSPATTAETPFRSQFATTRRITAGFVRATTTRVARTTQTASRSSVTTPYCSKS